MKKVLITGGAGFIGSHIADAFLEDGYDVVVIDNITTGSKRNISSKVLFYKNDLNDLKKVKEIISLEKPQIISHHASGLVGVKESILNPQKAFQDMIIAANVFEAAKDNDVKHIIFSSSANVYAKTTLVPIVESSPVNPLSPYGITKLAIEAYCQYLTQIWNMKFTIFRYFNVYGPRQRIGDYAGIVSSIINKALKNEEIIISGSGKQSRDFIYVKDIAYANLMAAKKKIEGVFNVGTMKDVSINELIYSIERIMGKKLKKKYKTSFDQINRSLADNTKIKKVLQWEPKTKIIDGLKETILSYRDLC
jgi:UDP-glucose 4-epimerase